MLYSEADYRRRLEKSVAVFEPETYRDEFRRDYARLLHSPSFRRLQGKTQLFPGIESDFFRNRLTHSLEVAQIAKSIAIRLNSISEYFQNDPINLDLVEFAGLAHDLGHPPFGHNGEQVLDKLMLEVGGFEGNAQTFRILSTLEKKELTEQSEFYGVGTAGEDFRRGLNLTNRSMASILKYDHQIPDFRHSDGLIKGFYTQDDEYVRSLKAAMEISSGVGLKCVECQIMDIADDIAYSTYDLEDALKAGFFTPLSLFASNEQITSNVIQETSKKLSRECTEEDVRTILLRIFRELFDSSRHVIAAKLSDTAELVDLLRYFQETSQNIAQFGYLRTSLTSYLIGKFIRGIQVELEQTNPALSKVKLDPETFEEVETLKHFTYYSIIESPRLKLVRHRGQEIVRYLFNAIVNSVELMPSDFLAVYNRQNDHSEKMRTICDFVAGMTDRYAIEFYARLTSENPQTIFKPH